MGTSLLSYVRRVLDGRDKVCPISEALMVLIPKVDNPSLILQFRPISLSNVIYKLITKTIVNRLKPILAVVISSNQGSFVSRRQITDNIIICQENIHTLQRRKGSKGGMIIKINLEIAYDGLEWGFVRETLCDEGLPGRMVEVIEKCISSGCFRLLWNKEATETIIVHQGVKARRPDFSTSLCAMHGATVTSYPEGG